MPRGMSVTAASSQPPACHPGCHGLFYASDVGVYSSGARLVAKLAFMQVCGIVKVEEGAFTAHGPFPLTRMVEKNDFVSVITSHPN